jgi:lipid-binding SYLF domain-containing protein
MRFTTAVAVCACASLAFAESDDEKRLQDAALVFSEVMNTPDRAIPQELLERAHCAVIVPGLKKGAFIVGGKFGRGFLSCRNKNRVGWTAPAAVRVEGGSFGLQLGVSETDVIMLIMNERGAERLLSSKFTIGGDASAAAGPVGRTASADTDATLRAEILTWSRARGLFAGVSLQGATLRQDQDVNKSLYGKPYTNRQIVNSGLAVPTAAAGLLKLLNKYSSRS